AAHVLVNLDKYLHVRKSAHTRLGERQVEIVRDRLGKRPIAVAGKDLHLPSTGVSAVGRDPPASQICNVATHPRVGNVWAQDFPADGCAPRATSCIMPSCAETATM